MAQEIERKYIVTNDSFKAMSIRSYHIIQGYIHTDPRAVVRVRIRDDKAFLTIKSENKGAVRNEWEYGIPVNDARMMVDKLCQASIIEKTRYIIDYDSHIWEVDCFDKPCGGLVIAEIELQSEDENFTLPPFVGREVTGDPAYYNSAIASTSHQEVCATVAKITTSDISANNQVRQP